MNVKHVLSEIAPDTISEVIEDGLGFQLEIDGRPIRLSAISDPERDGDRVACSFRHDDSDLEVAARWDLDREHKAAVLQLTLTNCGSEGSPAFSALNPVSLTLKGAREMKAKLRSVGGGLKLCYYPTDAYKDRVVSVAENGGIYPFRIESGPDGRSSSRDLPMLLVTVGDDNPSVGIFLALEWSAMWFMQADFHWASKDVKIQGGPKVSGLTLESGEELSLPPAHLVFFEGDMSAGTNAARRYIYEVICPDLDGQRPLPPVSYDHWFGIGNHFDEDFMKQQVDRASELGLEYFTLDAGWYKGCGPGFDDFGLGVGNWEFVDERKFPNGLEPLAEYVRSKGMKFGLWFDVEHAHRTSDLVKRHPEWFWDVGGDFLHQNLTLKEVQDYLIELVGGYIKRLDLRWARWDYNIAPKPFWEKVDPTGKIQFAYVKGLYRVLDTLMRENRGWLVECCASGGQRIDLGTLRRAHTIWASDHTEDPNICRFMQTGVNRFLPGHLPNSAVPVAKGQGGREIVRDFDVISRMCGALSFDGDVASWSAELTSMAGKLVRTYKEIRHLLVQDFYPLLPHPASDSDWDGVQFVSYEKDEAVVLIFRMSGEEGQKQLRLRGLNPDTNYRVVDPVSDEKDQDVSGRELTEKGLNFTLVPNSAALRHLQERGQARIKQWRLETLPAR